MTVAAREAAFAAELQGTVVAAHATLWRAEGGERPVFLDEGGRRAHFVRVLGAAGAALVAGAVLLVVIAATGFSHVAGLPATLAGRHPGSARPITVGATGGRAGTHTRIAAVARRRRPALVDPRRQAAMATLAGIHERSSGPVRLAARPRLTTGGVVDRT